MVAQAHLDEMEVAEADAMAKAEKASKEDVEAKMIDHETIPPLRRKMPTLRTRRPCRR